jgi:hypothetical protein
MDAGMRGALVVLVKEPRQLLAQSLIALGSVPERDGALEQPLLNFARQLAPCLHHGLAQNLAKPPLILRHRNLTVVHALRFGRFML